MFLKLCKFLAVTMFNSEKDMLNSYKIQQFQNFDETIMAVVFENKSTDFSTNHFKYKILTSKTLPKKLYSDVISTNIYGRDEFPKEITSVQICLDEGILRLKTGHLHVDTYVSTRIFL